MASARRVHKRCHRSGQEAEKVKPKCIDANHLRELRLLYSLSKKQSEVLYWIALGLNTKMIAKHMRVSAKAVEYHRANLYRKTGFENPVDLCRFAIRTKLIIP